MILECSTEQISIGTLFLLRISWNSVHCTIRQVAPAILALLKSWALKNNQNIADNCKIKQTSQNLKVHKIENFFGSEFEFYTILLLVMLKY